MFLAVKYLGSVTCLVAISITMLTSSTFITGAELDSNQGIETSDVFAPAQINGNVLWLDASDLDGDGIAGGAYVNNSVWIDKSSSGLANARQDNSAAKPPINDNALNGFSALTFSSGKFLDLHQDSFSMLRDVEGATLFAFLKPQTQNAGQRVLMIATNESQKTRGGLSLFDDVSYDQEGSYLGGDGDFGITGRVLDSDLFQRIEGGTVNTGVFQQYSGVIDYTTGSMKLYVNGTLETETQLLNNPGRTSDTNSSNIRIGADANLGAPSGFFEGEIGELIVYNRSLQADERAHVEDYLNNKWLLNQTIPEFTIQTSETSTSETSSSSSSTQSISSTTTSSSTTLEDPLTTSTAESPVAIYGSFLIMFTIITKIRNTKD